MVLKTIGTYNSHWMSAVIRAEEMAGATGRKVRVYMRGGWPVTVLTPFPIRKKKEA